MSAGQLLQRSWRAMVPNGLADDAVATAVEIADRLRSPELSGSWATDPENGAGCAVLFGQLDRLLPDQGWAQAAHAGLTAAAGALERAGTGFPGLFGGASGVAFAANALSCGGTRYQRLRAALDVSVAASATMRGESVARNPRGLPFGMFDVIAGATGFGAYLLARRGDPGSDAALDAVLTGLVALCGEDGDVPNWHTTFAAIAPGTPMAQLFPSGVFNSGLAHGVPGPLALLVLAHLAGVSVAGQREAIERVARWLAGHRSDDEWGPNWPSGFALPDAGGFVPPAHEPTHNAWCYGSPGVARALWLAGVALDEVSFRGLAMDSMFAVYRRPSSARRIDGSPGLCHGVAGLLQITSRFAHDTGDPRFVDAAVTFTTRLLDLYEPTRTFGYGFRAEDGSLADEPGLLDGAAGVALALLAAGTDLAPDWDRMLLLA